MSKSYYRLRDTGSSFYDMTQGAGVVRSRVEALENTAQVKEAVRTGALIKLDVEEGKTKFAEQQEADATQAKEQAELAKNGNSGVSALTASATSPDTATTSGGDGSNVAKTEQDSTADEDSDENADNADQADRNDATKKATTSKKGK